MSCEFETEFEIAYGDGLDVDRCSCCVECVRTDQSGGAADYDCGLELFEVSD